MPADKPKKDSRPPGPPPTGKRRRETKASDVEDVQLRSPASPGRGDPSSPGRNPSSPGKGRSARDNPGSPRSEDGSPVSGRGQLGAGALDRVKAKKQDLAQKRIDAVLAKRRGGGSCPRCRCCFKFCPCMFCCQPDELLTQAELVDSMRTANNNRGAVNMSIVGEQLKQDRERISLHKDKWRRRWSIGCCCCCVSILVGFTVSVVLLALGSWTLLCISEDGCGWKARMHFGAIYTPDKKVVIAGGTDRERNFDDVWVGGRDGKSWRLLVDHAAFGPRHGHAFVVDANTGDMYVIAGDSRGVGGQASTPLQDVWRSTDGRDWVRMTARAAWPSRKFLGAAMDEEGHLYIVGGLTGYGTGGLNDLWKSEDQGVTWSPVTLAAAWTARHSFAFVRLPGGGAQGRFYILGGDDGQRQHDVWKSDDDGNTWQLMTFTHWREERYSVYEERAPWDPTSETSAVVSGEGLLTLTGGGRNGQDREAFSNEVWELPSPTETVDTWYNRKTKDPRVGSEWRPLKWEKSDTPQWSERQGHAVFIDEDATPYVMGGEDKNGLIVDMWAKRTSIDIRNLAVFYERVADMLQT